MIRRATAADHDWIRDVGALVYADFGDYHEILPTWVAHPGVLAYLDTEPDTDARRGFILVGFYEPTDVPRGTFVADLLAIAVAPPYQGQGVGRLLLDYAIDLAELAGDRMTVPELRLTVAHTNVRAQRLFFAAGFEILAHDHGFYDGGQRAIRMRRRLARP